MPKVSIIVLNWNGWKDTVECLESLYQINYPNYNVILVDNNSEDDSLEKISDYCKGSLKPESNFYKYDHNNKPIQLVEFQENELDNIYSNDSEVNTINDNFSRYKSKNKLILIKNNKNYGFAKGNNIGMNFALKVFDPDYIMLLNNDTVVQNDFLTELVKAATNSPEIGLAGSKILKYNNPKIIDSTGHLLIMGRIVDRGHEEQDQGQYDKPEFVIGAIAAACMYKREMLREIGFFDETFFTVYEDAELSWRSHKKGWKAIYVPTSVVYHKRGKSIKKKSVNAQMIMLQSRNMLTTTMRHGSNMDKFQYSFLILADGVYYLKERLAGRNNIKVSQLMFQTVKSYLIILYNIMTSRGIKYEDKKENK